MPTIDLRHRAASQSMIASVWELDLETMHVVAYVRMASGAPSVGCDLAVCSARFPIFGALKLERIDDETWRLMPERYKHGSGLWTTRIAPYDSEARLPLWPMILTHAPADVAAMLARL